MSSNTKGIKSELDRQPTFAFLSVVALSDVGGAWRKSKDVQSHHDTAHEKSLSSHQMHIKVEEAIGCKFTS